MLCDFFLQFILESKLKIIHAQVCYLIGTCSYNVWPWNFLVENNQKCRWFDRTRYAHYHTLSQCFILPFCEFKQRFEYKKVGRCPIYSCWLSFEIFIIHFSEQTFGANTTLAFSCKSWFPKSILKAFYRTLELFLYITWKPLDLIFTQVPELSIYSKKPPLICISCIPHCTCMCVYRKGMCFAVPVPNSCLELYQINFINKCLPFLT